MIRINIVTLRRSGRQPWTIDCEIRCVSDSKTFSVARARVLDFIVASMERLGAAVRIESVARFVLLRDCDSNEPFNWRHWEALLPPVSGVLY